MKKYNIRFVIMILLSFFLNTLNINAQGKNMKLISSAFKNGDVLPKKYTCDDKDVNPPLQWEDVPAGTQSFVLIMEDPDAPATKPEPWVHWIVFNISPSVAKLEENVAVTTIKGAKLGMTHSGKSEFHGACPPSGVHRYYFKLYALDTMLDLSAGVSKKDLLNAMKGHILAQAELMATYERK